MKHLYTSSFKRAGNHAHALSIARMPPQFYRGDVFPLLAPEAQLLRDYKAGRINDEQYTVTYNAMLKRLNAHDVAMQIPDRSILLCYEAAGQFCHRHLAAQWLRLEAGVSVAEI